MLLAGACASPSIVAPEPAELRIPHALEQWFTWLARREPARESLEHAIGAPILGEGLEFALAEDSPVPPEELQGWVEALRSPHSRVAYRLAGLTISRADEAAHRVRFALKRHAIDASGVAHIALSDQTWEIHSAPGGPIVVMRIASEPRLAFPGTGPQIVCY